MSQRAPLFYCRYAGSTSVVVLLLHVGFLLSLTTSSGHVANIASLTGLRTVPPKIINELSSTDKTVQEGETVTLVCNVTGVPIPEVTWYKLPNDGTQKKERLDLLPGTVTYIDSCTYTLQQTGIGTAGEILIIHNVSRYCDGYYECVANNNVDPAVSKQIKVFVDCWMPMTEMPIVVNRM